MAELAATERLQPSLLDRLSDHAPGNKTESGEQRVLSYRQLRQSVLRDLGWLLNTPAFEALQDLSSVPFAAHSVINYGIPCLSGVTIGAGDVMKIETKIRQAIINFEPRILARTLKIQMLVDNEAMSQKAICFNIEGDLWAQPLPIHLYIRSDLDLETGEVIVKDLGG